MGWVHKVRHQSGRAGWQARWRDPAGVERAKNFARRADAERYLVSLESTSCAVVTPTLVSGGPGSPTGSRSGSRRE